MTQSANQQEAALDWLVRTNDPDFEAWDEFTAWLEADPTNADAYHALVESEERMSPFVEAMPAADVVAPERKRPRLAIAAGVAALAAAATAIVAPRMMAVEYSTGPGEIRVVSLGGQDRLVMNGETRLELAGFDRRTVHLAKGQVLLDLKDPGQDKIELLSGDLRLVDVGTVFEVARDGQDTRVVVSEGAVVADPGGAGLKLMPGQRLDTTDGAAVLQAMPADISSVGSFERGQLSYIDEPIGHVVADLHRSTGIDFSASAAISARRFSGTLSVAEVKRDPRSLAPLLGVSVEQAGQGWKLGGKV
ncbi:FecR domain-containing protein [Sphingomonas sp. NSE70-1]|uniref:FecR domain-containing protein n=1 Tax=Sphingomonas caseinilyticus TaxID=2908205 RepID=A0ABT0RS79_9SPHN|nr:FecR domain-containing protein [Sphingomonas caseinilyticus]MCL6697867.1 FecR domain-containing protein [Sphingomonas caseinilyticus]